MDSVDHKKPTIAPAVGGGHEGGGSGHGHGHGGVHLCHRCGWPFPNPHPSAKHRRAHKKVCGKIEGYKLLDDDHHSPVSDDEHGSDDDLHTPSPNTAKANPKEYGSIGGVGEKSNKSEDDVFSDAVTEFSESGISPSVEERLQSVEELDTNAEQITVEEGDLIQKVDETADETGRLNDHLVHNNEEDQSKRVGLTTDAEVGGVSAGQRQPDLVKADIRRNLGVANVDGIGDNTIQQELVEAGQAADINRKKVSEDSNTSDPAFSSSVKVSEDSLEDAETIADSAVSESTLTISGASCVGEKTGQEAGIDRKEINLASLSSYSEDPKTSDPALGSVNINEEIHNLSVPDSEGVANSAVSQSIGNSFVIEKTDEVSNASPEATKVSDSTEAYGSVAAGDENASSEGRASIKIVDSSATEPSDGISNVSVNQEVKEIDCLDRSENADLNDGENHSETAHKNRNDKPKNNISVGIASDPGSLKCSLVSESAQMNAGPDHNNGSRVLDKSFPAASGLEDPVSSELPNNNNVTSSDIGNEIESEETVGAIPPSKDSGPSLNDSDETKTEGSSGKDISCSPAHGGSDIFLSEKAESCTKVEALPANKHGPAEDIEEEKLASEDDAKSPSEILPLPIDSQNLNGEDKNIITREIASGAVGTKERNGDSALDLSGGSVSRSDSLEGKCGSASENSDTNLQKTKTTTEAGSSDKDVFEPPSFMTLVQSGGEVETVLVNNQQPKPDDSLQKAGWFPSLTNVVNESEGRKKNEEIIAKVTNWSTGKQHGPLKNLLDEAKSPNTKQVPQAAGKDNGADDAKGQKDGEVAIIDKEIEKEWNSPARYPIEIKKEKKKKGRPYWVPFVCCSSVHRDL